MTTVYVSLASSKVAEFDPGAGLPPIYFGMATPIDDTTQLPLLQTQANLSRVSLTVSATATLPVTNVGAILLGKRVTAPVGTPVVTAAASAVNWSIRTVLVLPASTVRWRLRYANRNVLTNAALTTPLTIGNVYVGAPALLAAFATARWSGGFVSTPAQALPGFSVPTDGSDIVTGWVTDPTLQFVKGAPQMISWDQTTGGTGTGFGQSVTQAFLAVGANMANQVAATGFASAQGIIGDVRIEYEVSGNPPVGLFIDDSKGDGTGDGDVNATQQTALFHEKWPNLAAIRSNFAAINASVGSAGVAGNAVFASLSNYAWTRLDVATTVPDFAVLAIGSNDMGPGGLATAQSAYRSLMALVKSLGISRIYVCTIQPRCGSTGWAGNGQGYLTTSVAAGATSIVSSVNTGAVQVLIGSGRNQELRTVSAVSGTGPWTLTVPALTNAHTGGPDMGPGGAEQIAYGGSEIMRQQFNDWLRQLPDNAVGCFDVSREFETFRGSAFSDKRMMSVDMVHPLRSGYQLVAQLVSVAR